jgi:glycogen synthase
MTYSRAVFVIHNMAHQGRGPFIETEQLELPEKYREIFRLYDPIGGEHMNIMKAGLQFSHRIVAVSGEGLGFRVGTCCLSRPPLVASCQCGMGVDLTYAVALLWFS